MILENEILEVKADVPVLRLCWYENLSLFSRLELGNEVGIPAVV